MADFKGVYFHSLDAKSRMVVPSAFREALGQKFVIMKTIPMKSAPEDTCITLYPLDEWMKIKEDLDNLPPSEKNLKYYRKVFARIDDGSMDPQSRVLIKEQFREYAKIKKNIAILGSGKKIEIWDEDEWRRINEEPEDDFDYDMSLVRF